MVPFPKKESLTRVSLSVKNIFYFIFSVLKEGFAAFWSNLVKVFGLYLIKDDT